MKKLKVLNISLILVLIFAISCSKKVSKEVSPYYIRINGPMADRKQEISGMDWYRDNLFLLPENLNGYVFLIKKWKQINNDIFIFKEEPWQ